MPKCNSALQAEKDRLQPKFDQISHKIAKFLEISPFLNPKYPKNIWAFPC